MRMTAGIMIAISLLSVPAVAEEGITGTWSTKEGCDRLVAMAKDPDAAWKGNFYQISYLTKDGINGYEWGCTFGKASTDADGKTMYRSECSEEGNGWTALLKVERIGKGWGVTAMPEASQDGESTKPVTLVYGHRCGR